MGSQDDLLFVLAFIIVRQSLKKYRKKSFYKYFLLFLAPHNVFYIKKNRNF